MVAVLLWCLIPQTGGAQAQKTTVQALLVSDVHFDPFWDPDKVAKLAVAPAAQWTRILAAADSPQRQQAFDALGRACPTRGYDTSFPLLASSVNAMRAQAGGAGFMLLSGDLLAHGFDCKYEKRFPQAAKGDYARFAEKTIQFVLLEMSAAARGMPVYAALGNNDSECSDYKVDAHSAFLAAVGRSVTKELPGRERTAAQSSFAAYGNYAVMLPAPLENTRLIVMDDVFFSPRHKGCGNSSGASDAADQAAQLKWLANELDAARTARQTVWVMAHIAPGVDAFSTLAHVRGACSRPAKMLLESNGLADTISGAADVVKLAVFGHTHEDEIKLLEKPGGGAVPAKIVAAISPINGNLPSFTVAQVDAATATMTDYVVIAGSNKVAWAEQYEYAKAYGESDFSASAVKDLIGKMAADRNAKEGPSEQYVHHFLIGNPLPLLELVWPQYVCTMTEQTAEGFSGCACAKGGKP